MNTNIMINGKLLDVNTVEFDGVDFKDYPDFSDVFILSAAFVDGTLLNDDEIDFINSNHDLVYTLLINHLY